MNIVQSNEAEENLDALREGYRRMEGSLPKLEDLQGAAQGLMRLQDVYDLRVEGLVRGHFQQITNGNAVDIYKPPVSDTLSGDDCFLVGKVAYDSEDYYHSVQWFEEAVRLFRGTEWSPENEGTLEDALDHLAFSHFKTGNISYALSLSQELLLHDPVNSRVHFNVEKYEKLLDESPPVTNQSLVLKRPDSTCLRTRNVYEKLCQTKGSQPKHFENPRLFCDFFTNGNPGLLLQPIKRELISLHPYVVLFHTFVTRAEAKSIREYAVPGAGGSERGRICCCLKAGDSGLGICYCLFPHGPEVQNVGDLLQSLPLLNSDSERVVSVAAFPVIGLRLRTRSVRIRMSFIASAWLKDSAHGVVGKVDRRITMVTGLNVQPPYAEYLQVVNYGIGGHYEPHFDHATSDSSPLYRLKTGNRVATFMIYLSSVEAGGYTAFIYANFSVPVVENGALFWWNLHRNGQGNVNTLHAGCPVIVGDKWVANKWVHEYGQEFQRRCSLNPEE
ncbi:prolyl 4-hydroxylase subunit alpha-3 isoform X3 [Onychostoma macrolepis]|nr:prolyl 4-hydroxylase subunit alpha-3 isoform X3 [Onychostoma macrolepis]